MLARADKDRRRVEDEEEAKQALHDKLASGETQLSEVEIERDIAKQEATHAKQAAQDALNAQRKLEEDISNLNRTNTELIEARDEKEQELVAAQKAFLREAEDSHKAAKDARTLVKEKEETIILMNEQIARLTSVEFIESVGKEFSGVLAPNPAIARAQAGPGGRARSSTETMFHTMFGRQGEGPPDFARESFGT